MINRTGAGRQLRDTALTLVFGAAGALGFSALGYPAPFLSGPALVVTLATLAGLPAIIPNLLLNIAFLLLGLGIGAGVTPEVFAAAATWPLSIVALALVLIATIFAGRTLLQSGFGFDRRTATMSAVPGLLSYMLSLASESRVDLARVSLVQGVRVLLLTLVVPFAFSLFGAELPPPARPTVVMLPLIVAILFVVASLGGTLLQRLRVPAAYILAGLVVAAFGQLTGLALGALPQGLSLAAFVVVGSLIGSRFRGLSLKELRATALAGVSTTMLAGALAAIAGLLVAWLLELPVALVLVAFAPGGVEVMIAMSVQLGLDSTFVAAHHVARLLILMAVLPFIIPRPR
ncbi:MAG: AbrB family transcriptional regulator [Halocynthiibacter sp.]